VIILNQNVSEQSNNSLNIDYIKNQSKIPVYTVKHGNSQNFLWTVCVSPTFYWENPVSMKIFLDYYLKHGASKIILYKRRWSKGVDKLLIDYKNDVITYPWPKFPRLKNVDLNDGSIAYYGQVLAINDCLWKMKYK